MSSLFCLPITRSYQSSSWVVRVMKYPNVKAPNFCWWLYLVVVNLASYSGLRKMNYPDLILRMTWSLEWSAVQRFIWYMLTPLISSVSSFHLFFPYVHLFATKTWKRINAVSSHPTQHTFASYSISQLWNFKQCSIKFVLMSEASEKGSTHITSLCLWSTVQYCGFFGTQN